MMNDNLYPAKFIYLNCQLLEVVSRYRDPQPQVVDNYSYICLNWDQTFTNFDVWAVISFPNTW